MKAIEVSDLESDWYPQIIRPELDLFAPEILLIVRKLVDKALIANGQTGVHAKTLRKVIIYKRLDIKHRRESHHQSVGVPVVVHVGE